MTELMWSRQIKLKLEQDKPKGEGHNTNPPKKSNKAEELKQDEGIDKGGLEEEGQGGITIQSQRGKKIRERVILNGRTKWRLVPNLWLEDAQEWVKKEAGNKGVTLR